MIKSNREYNIVSSMEEFGKYTRSSCFGGVRQFSYWALKVLTRFSEAINFKRLSLNRITYSKVEILLYLRGVKGHLLQLGCTK